MNFLKLNMKYFGIKTIMSLVILLLSQGNALAAENDATMGMSAPVFFIVFLTICIAIGIVAVLAGVGGGVVFTPLMMGFTPVDSFIIRATGLFVAMVGALVAARPFLRSGLANIRMLYFAAVPYATFAVIGALLAGYVKETMGMVGEAYIRLGLGVLVIFIAMIFVFAGQRIEYPEVRQVDGFTSRVGLAMAYWEESLGRVVNYEVTRSWLGVLMFCGVGLISGLFGLGAGWAMVPVFNLVMMAPLKVSAACSKVLIGIGDTAAVWPYIMGGGIFPLFAVPCMIGLMVGTIIGAKILLKVKAGFVRWLIIGIMLISGIRLIMKGLEIFGVM
ncbi:sulfite exporter TauE/SafE family protein [Archaeoglobales archaeon]|nr:MAG: sulfite exporter TauE/SafE family protein [Archaeoglobales archaeon]